MTIAASNTWMLNNRGASVFQWVNAQSITSSDQTTAMVGVEIFAQATLYLKVTAMGNTSADFYLQKLLPDGATWQDIAHWAQFTGTGNRVIHMVSGGNKEEAQQKEALAASTVNAVPFGSQWRISVVLVGAGTTTFSLWVEGLV